MNNQILLCKIYLDNFAKKSNRFYFPSSCLIKKIISNFFDNEISDDAFLAAIKPMFEHRHIFDEHYLFKVRLKPPEPKRFFTGNGSYYQYTANLFECDGIFYKPTIKNGILVFEQIFNKNICKEQEKNRKL